MRGRSSCDLRISNRRLSSGDFISTTTLPRSRERRRWSSFLDQSVIGQHSPRSAARRKGVDSPILKVLNVSSASRGEPAITSRLVAVAGAESLSSMREIAQLRTLCTDSANRAV